MPRLQFSLLLQVLPYFSAVKLTRLHVLQSAVEMHGGGEPVSFKVPGNEEAPALVPQAPVAAQPMTHWRDEGGGVA